MLSILIPVYNWLITPLVGVLHRQCSEAGILFEIRCLDDGSDPAFCKQNREVGVLDGVVYEELERNVGRSRIRNLLAEGAQFEYLLFLDVDSEVVRSDYIRRYLDVLQPDTVFCGGREYAPHPPEDKRYRLHWEFGRKREQTPATVRNRHPYRSFMTNNFVAPRSVVLAIGFDPRLNRYGHEDTLFGEELEARGIPIVHLDNPLKHLGLESGAVFLEKSRQAVENLVFLAGAGVKLNTRLWRFYSLMKHSGTESGALRLLGWSEGFLRRNLLGKHPNLLFLDALKVRWLIQLLEERGR